jgi:hypothetical protein
VLNFAAYFFGGDPHPDDHRDNKCRCDKLENPFDRFLVDGKLLNDECASDARKNCQREPDVHGPDEPLPADLPKVDNENADDEGDFDSLPKRNYERFNHTGLPLRGDFLGCFSCFLFWHFEQMPKICSVELRSLKFVSAQTSRRILSRSSLTNSMMSPQLRQIRWSWRGRPKAFSNRA